MCGCSERTKQGAGACEVEFGAPRSVDVESTAGPEKHHRGRGLDARHEGGVVESHARHGESGINHPGNRLPSTVSKASAHRHDLGNIRGQQQRRDHSVPDRTVSPGDHDDLRRNDQRHLGFLIDRVHLSIMPRGVMDLSFQGLSMIPSPAQ